MQDLRSLLAQTLETPHFLIRYGLRCPRTGRGNPEWGVQDMGLVLRYAESLELAYESLTSTPIFDWRLSGLQGQKTRVYVYDTHRFRPHSLGFAELRDGEAVIWLASRGTEPSIAAEFQRAAATAVHELTHAFNFMRRAPAGVADVIRDPWDWFYEGTAVFMETYVYPENPDCLRYFLNWCDHPEMPLADLSCIYQAGMFVRFLNKRMGSQVITDAWSLSTAATPIDAIEQALANQVPFASAAPGSPDVFSDYCAHAYFLFDPNSACFSPEILSRYGERMVTESFSQSVQGSAGGDSIDYLACRYYRFTPTHNSVSLTVELTPTTPETGQYLRADLIEVTRQRKRGQTVPLTPTASGQPQSRLVGTLPDFTNRDVDHVVLIVTNCSHGTNAVDGLTYTLDAKVT